MIYHPSIDVAGMPSRIKALPICPRFRMPVPWFVAWKDGVPEFRAMDGAKLRAAVQFRKCWVCGEQMGSRMTFVLGPMCGINRNSAEPPSHHECAEWSARNCPFLSNAKRARREDDVIDNESLVRDSAGIAIPRNPGVTLLWTTRSYVPFKDGRGGVLFSIGDPESVEFYANGRKATRQEIDESVSTGLPILVGAANTEGPEALAELRAMQDRFALLLPA